MDRVLKSPPPAPQLDAGIPVRGTVSLAGRGPLDLAQATDRPLVLVMAGEFCVTCIEEVDVYREAMNGTPPENIRFVTLLVEGDEAMAADWKDLHGVPWDVGFESGDSIFQTWCPERLTPCVIVQLPERGVVLRKAGAVSPAEIEAFTGAWR